MTKPPLILVVDDATHIVNVLAVKLQSAGYEILRAYDGETALHIAIDAWHAYDAVHGEDVTAVGCWAHARRKFKEAEKALPKSKQKSARRNNISGVLL